MANLPPTKIGWKSDLMFLQYDFTNNGYISLTHPIHTAELLLLKIRH